jgi:hypothetical protein
LLAATGVAEAWALVERFASLHRVSGSEDEWTAACYIRDRLASLGVPHQMLRPRLYLSIPRQASVRLSTPSGGVMEFAAKTPSFSVSTADRGEGLGWVRGPAVYVPAGAATGIGDLFAAAGGPAGGQRDLAGRIALTDGLPMPARVRQLQLRGAEAAVFISPGDRIHEAICTPVWGTPDLTTADQRPTLPVASVSGPDGALLRKSIAAARDDGRPLVLAVRTRLDEGWHECPLLVAEITGQRWPEEFVLLHGHLDSWHAGIGDNAVGNGAMLEIARLLWTHRQDLDRTVRIAWWPGHSTGRYAGSTWYADHYARDIYRNCIVHLNCDSPGCRWATSFHELTVMAETDSLAYGVVRDAAGLPAEGALPERAGDLSFSNLGVSTLFMLSSTMSPEDRQAHGYYAVGGCGGNIGWHTEDDTLEIADRDNLLRDTRVYALAVWRAANDRIHPLDFRATAAQLNYVLGEYEEKLGSSFDLSRSRAAVAELARAVDRLYRQEVVAAQSAAAPDARVTSVNAKLRRLGRVLVNLLYSQAGRYRQDPALPVPPLPELDAAAKAVAAVAGADVAAGAAGGVDPGFVATEVLRAQNRIVGAVDEAIDVIGCGS